MEPEKKSFRSFNSILDIIPKLKLTVDENKLYYAHLSSPASNQQPESLQDHIDLVTNAALELIKTHSLEANIDKIINSFGNLLPTKDSSEITCNFIKELFLATIVFHDFGKINENFQNERMQNVSFGNVSLLIGSQHSVLSGYLFLNYYLDKLEKCKFSDDTEYILAGVICAFADPILKHHSPTLEINDLDEAKCNQLQRFLRFIGMDTPANYWQDIIKSKVVFEQDILKNIKGQEYFHLFALLKLNFSLLTAADYLATLSYQYHFQLPKAENTQWYGVFTKEEKLTLYNKFKESAPYNKEALEHPEILKNIPLSNLNEISWQNLNLLRSRILGEVVSNVRKNKDNKLFYLKSPTGSGKTNISLAAALELLQYDEKLNKVYYVFPFTTLITQTYSAIKETLYLDDNQIVQLHSKAEWQTKNPEERKDGLYKNEWINHIDNLFVQYPIALLSHIRFFDILKSNRKEVNYLMHRIANSVVIIDELQSYSPQFWEHINFFISNYAVFFNIRFIVMSATLPEIGKLTIGRSIQWVQLLEQPEMYFQNPNFAKRITFDFSLINSELPAENKEGELDEIADFVGLKSEEYAKNNNGNVKTIIEFITKKSSAEFAEKVKDHPVLGNYKVLLLTGTILEPRRKEVIFWLKNEGWQIQHPKVLLISTQVVEAGVDIDMDIGFKDNSLIDSDEQLAGRVNRNATKKNNKVFLFNLDGEGIVYKGDERLNIQSKLSSNEKELIYTNKNFNLLYDKIIEKFVKETDEGFISRFRAYKEFLQKLNFKDIDFNFQLIKDETKSVFIPLSISIDAFTEKENDYLKQIDIAADSAGEISGEDIFSKYEAIVKNKSNDFIENRDKVKQIQSLLSKFTIAVYPQTAEMIKRQIRMTEEIEKFGFIYWSDYQKYYSFEFGLNFPKEEMNYDFL